jgi:23S rRNA (uridine2552-2'-O)-methyltransferase
MQGNMWEDHYARRAKTEAWLARSVYKIQEIDNRFKLIRKNNRVMDLGCYPGSWSQYGLNKVGPKGEVVGIDLKEPERVLAANFRFIQADVLEIDLAWLVKEIAPMDVIMSDMAPQTTGISISDVTRSAELTRRAFDIAFTVLKKKGHFICKILEGEELNSFKSDISTCFQRIRLFRPKATRKRSREVYLLGLERTL